jgi:hypothetical protein
MPGKDHLFRKNDPHVRDKGIGQKELAQGPLQFRNQIDVFGDPQGVILEYPEPGIPAGLYHRIVQD